MTNGEAVNWLINISADIGKAEHRALWHYEQTLDEIREMLESAQPEPQWIPVSKKYPPVYEEVLVTYSIDRRKRRYVYTAYWNGNDWLSVWDEYRVSGQSIRYYAWMPLPKPYTEDKA